MIQNGIACGLKRDKLNWNTREITTDSVFADGRIRGIMKTNRAHGLPILPEMEEY